jgi:glycosyltransferase involved in cell wall biosynthesis
LKKVLFVLHYPPPIHGSSVVGLFIKKSELINKTFSTRYINLSTSHSVDEIGSGGLYKVFRYLNIILRLVFQLIFFNPSLVYISITAKNIAFYKDSLLVFIVKLFRKRLVFHFHNKGVSSRANFPFDRWLYKRVLSDANVILLSPYLTSDLSNFCDPSKIHYCPNGIPDEVNYSERINDDYITLNHVPKILFLSNLIKSKGVFVLLAACLILKEKGLVFKSDFVGGEGDVSVSELNSKIEELKLSDVVEYKGKKYGFEKTKELVGADIFVLPTYYDNECFPLVLLEAMSFSLPVISTKEGGIQSIIDHGVTGFIVDKNNPEILAERLEQLLKDAHLRKEMGNKARQKYEKLYRLDSFELRITEILSELA